MVQLARYCFITFGSFMGLANSFVPFTVTATVTVTEEFVVRALQLVRWRITQSNCRGYDAP